MWTTNTHGVHVTWVTVIRDSDHVRCSRVSTNGTAGFVDVRCVPDPKGTRVHVRYDLTGTNRAGVGAVRHFAEGYDDMLDEWRDVAAGILP